MKTLRKSLLATGIACLALSGPASAIPFKFTYTDTVDAFPPSSISGVSAGDPLTIEIIADNGGTSAVSQIWDNFDITHASLSAGASYAATYDIPFASGLIVFVTDALGQLSFVDFDGFVDGTDVFGGPSLVYVHGGSGIFSSSEAWPPPHYAYFDPSAEFDHTRWSISAVPEPSILALVGIGLFGAGLARRRVRA